jgi:hypothetical protein
MIDQVVKMSQRSRQTLATDAEKLYACYQLWIKYNELLAFVVFLMFLPFTHLCL